MPSSSSSRSAVTALATVQLLVLAAAVLQPSISANTLVAARPMPEPEHEMGGIHPVAFKADIDDLPARLVRRNAPASTEHAHLQSEGGADGINQILFRRNLNNAALNADPHVLKADLAAGGRDNASVAPQTGLLRRTAPHHIARRHLDLRRRDHAKKQRQHGDSDIDSDSEVEQGVAGSRAGKLARRGFSGGSRRRGGNAARRYRDSDTDSDDSVDTNSATDSDSDRDRRRRRLPTQVRRVRRGFNSDNSGTDGRHSASDSDHHRRTNQVRRVRRGFNSDNSGTDGRHSASDSDHHHRRTNQVRRVRRGFNSDNSGTDGRHSASDSDHHRRRRLNKAALEGRPNGRIQRRGFNSGYESNFSATDYHTDTDDSSRGRIRPIRRPRNSRPRDNRWSNRSDIGTDNDRYTDGDSDYNGIHRRQVNKSDAPASAHTGNVDQYITYPGGKQQHLARRGYRSHSGDSSGSDNGASGRRKRAARHRKLFRRARDVTDGNNADDTSHALGPIDLKERAPVPKADPIPPVKKSEKEPEKKPEEKKPEEKKPEKKPEEKKPEEKKPETKQAAVKSDAPKADAPKADAPATEAPKADAPKPEEPPSFWSRFAWKGPYAWFK